MRRIFWTTYSPSHKANGDINAGGTVAFKAAGTSNDKATFAEYSLSTTNSNPITLNSEGYADVFLAEDGMYAYTILDASGSTVDSQLIIGNDKSAVLTDLSECLISNASFETAGSGVAFKNWLETNPSSEITRDTTGAVHGAACALFTATNSSDHYITSNTMEINTNRAILIDLWVKSDNATAQPQAWFNWYDKDQAYISSTAFYVSDASLTPTSWTGIKLSVPASTIPATTQYANMVLYGNAHATNYTTRFDNVCVKQSGVFGDVAPFVPFGLTLSTDTDAAHDLNVSAGAVKNDDFTEDIFLDTEITKRIDGGAWSVGDDNPGLDGSLAADTPYGVWLIKNSGTGAVDVLISTSFTSPTLPGTYDVKRLIGYILTDSASDIEPFVHKGRIFRFIDPVEMLNDATLTDTTWETATLDVPPNCIIFGVLHCVMVASGTEQEIYMKPGDEADNANDGYAWLGANMSAGVDFEEMQSRGHCYVDASSQVDYMASDGGNPTGPIIFKTHYVEMLTRDNP